MVDLPATSIDIYLDADIVQRYGTYAKLCEMGPVVHMPAHGLYALSRVDDVRKAAIDFRAYSSPQGIAVNSRVNGMSS
jgi:hypothetical protein